MRVGKYLLKQRSRMILFSIDICSSCLTKLRPYFKPLSIAFIGFVIRLVIGVEGVHGTDILFHIKGVESVLLLGSPYCLATYNYPPLYAYIQLIGIVIVGWNTLGYKLMVILFDVALSIVIYTIVSSLGVGEKLSLITQALWCFNPIAIVASSWYGLFDSIPSLFSLLSILLITRRKYIASALVLSFGILTKIFPIIFLPVNIFVLFTKGGKRRDVGIYLTTLLSVIVLVELLATFRCLDDAIKDQFLFHIERVDKGLSLTPWYPYSSSLSVVITMAFSLILLLKLKQTKFNNSYIYLVSAITSTTLIIVNPFVYPHYLIWSLPLTLIALVIALHNKVKVSTIFKVSLALILIFSTICLGYWKFYKVHLIVTVLRYIFNLSLVATLIILIALYLRLSKQKQDLWGVSA